MFLCIFEDIVVLFLLIFNNKYRSYAWSTITHDISVTTKPNTLKFSLCVQQTLLYTWMDQDTDKLYIFFNYIRKFTQNCVAKIKLSDLSIWKLSTLLKKFLYIFLAPQIMATYVYSETQFHFSVLDCQQDKYHAHQRTTDFARRVSRACITPTFLIKN